jgi:hypothetical protein
MPGLSDIAKQAGWSFAALAAIVRLSLVYPAFPQIAAAQASPVRIPEGLRKNCLFRSAASTNGSQSKAGIAIIRWCSSFMVDQEMP